MTKEQRTYWSSPLCPPPCQCRQGLEERTGHSPQLLQARSRSERFRKVAAAHVTNAVPAQSGGAGDRQETLAKSLKTIVGAALRTLQFAKPLYTQGLVDHSQNFWGGWRLGWARMSPTSSEKRGLEVSHAWPDSQWLEAQPSLGAVFVFVVQLCQVRVSGSARLKASVMWVLQSRPSSSPGNCAPFHANGGLSLTRASPFSAP